jgi:hypothetical protein
MSWLVSAPTCRHGCGLLIQAASGARDTHLPAGVVAAIIAGAFSLLVLALTTWLSSQRDRDNRRRDMYSKAFAAVASYKEFPYVVRRRRVGEVAVAAEERVRISEDLRRVQEQLSYFAAWMAIESGRVAAAYRHLVAETRRIAGSQIHRAWLESPITEDAGMNLPDIGIAELVPAESAYLAAVSDHLSWWPQRRWRPQQYWPPPPG